MRSVRYGCSRTRSHSPAPSGPRLSQIAFETPSRPKSCTSPARRSVRTSASDRPKLRAGRGGEVGHRAGVAEAVRRLQIDEVRDRQQRGVEPLRARARRRAPARRRSPPPRSRRRRGRRGSLGLGARAAPPAPGRTACRALASERLRRARPRRRGARPRRTPRAARAAPRAGPPRPSARPATRARPTARTPPPSASSTSSGSPSCSPSARAIAAWWTIMSATSRWPERANSSPTRNRCSGALPAPSRRIPAAAARRLRNSWSYLPDFSAMSSPNHFACSCASE